MRYHLAATLEGGSLRTDPPEAPDRAFVVAPSTGAETLLFEDHFEVESGWTVEDLGPVTAGTWERGDPNPTSTGGVPVSPDLDYTPAPGTHCFTTFNAPPGAFSHNGDLDGGPTALVSPPIDLRNTDATCRYAVWHFCNDLANPAEADRLEVQVSNDGVTWVTADSVDSTGSLWKLRSFRINEFITPGESTRIRFVVDDTPNNSMTDSAIDAVQVFARPCGGSGKTCPGDLNGDGLVNSFDLGAVLAAWGQLGEGPTDLDGDGLTGGADLAAVLSSWGPCP
jgi:hypothetical protein